MNLNAAERGEAVKQPLLPRGRKPVIRAGDPTCLDLIVRCLSWCVFICTCPCSIWCAIKTCYEYERATIFSLGRLKDDEAKGPGVFFVLPLAESIRKVDLRTVSFTVPKQEVLSKDSVTVEVDAVIYFKVSDPVAATVAVENATFSTQLLAQTTLRTMLGTRTLAEMLQDRESLSKQMQARLDEGSTPWGIQVERVEFKEIRLPVGMQRAMAAEAEATREARGKIVAAEGERQAATALRDAALLMVDTPAALQLRFLQTLNTISAEHNSTIIFPFPMDLFSCFMPKPPPCAHCETNKPADAPKVAIEAAPEVAHEAIETALKVDDGGIKLTSRPDALLPNSPIAKVPVVRSRHSSTPSNASK